MCSLLLKVPGAFHMNHACKKEAGQLNSFIHRLLVLSEHPHLPRASRSHLKDIIENLNAVVSSQIQLKYRSQTKLPTIELPPSVTIARHSIVVLLGAPGCGKSTLGNALKMLNKVDVFLDTGARLKDRGELDRCYSLPTVSRRAFMSSEARLLLQRQLDAYMSSDGEFPFMTTFVKQPEDAYTLLQLVNAASCTHSTQFSVQTVFTTSGFAHGDYSAPLVTSLLHCPKRRTDLGRLQRQKWVANNAAIVEVFAELNGTVPHFRILPTPVSNRTRRRLKTTSVNWGERTRSFHRATEVPLVLNSHLRSKLKADLKLALDTADVLPRVPASFVCTQNQVEWLCYPSRYRVSPKVLGTRCFLFHHEEGVFLFNRGGSISQARLDYQNSSAWFPIGSVLDGILVPRRHMQGWHGKDSLVFAAFDMLSNGQRSISLWPYADRMAELRACLAVHAVEHSDHESCASNECAHPGSQAPLPSISVRLVESFDITPSRLAAILDYDSEFSCGFPEDGLVFTPTEMPYVFGPDSLLFTWQNKEDIRIDLEFSRDDFRPYGKERADELTALMLSMLDSYSLKFLGLDPPHPAEYGDLEGFVFSCVYRHERWLPVTLHCDRPSRF
jgi:hypothetical protein